MEIAPAIQDVAGHGATGMRQVQADLMGPTRHRLRQHQRAALARTQHAECGLGRLAPGTVVDPVLAVLGGVGPQGFAADPFTQAWDAVGDGQVGLLDGTLGEHPRQGRHGPLALREEQHPGGGRVEAVHETQEPQVPGPRPPLARFDGVDEGALEPAVDVFAVVRPEHPAGGLVDGQHAAVLVEDVHDRPVGQFEAGRFGHARSHHIGAGTSRQTCRRAGGAAAARPREGHDLAARRSVGPAGRLTTHGVALMCWTDPSME